MRFQPGEIILRRHFMRDTLARVWAGHVAADDAHGLWLWIASGSVFRDIGAADGRPFRRVPFEAWGHTAKRLHELTWAGDVLMLAPGLEPAQGTLRRHLRDLTQMWVGLDEAREPPRARPINE
jgi:hypothetical protein